MAFPARYTFFDDFCLRVKAPLKEGGESRYSLHRLSTPSKPDQAPGPLKILALLTSAPGDLFALEDIALELGTSADDKANIVRAQVVILRGYIGDDANQQRLIKTERRRGYRFVGKAITLEDEAGALRWQQLGFSEQKGSLQIEENGSPCTAQVDQVQRSRDPESLSDPTEHKPVALTDSAEVSKVSEFAGVAAGQKGLRVGLSLVPDQRTSGLPAELPIATDQTTSAPAVKWADVDWQDVRNFVVGSRNWILRRFASKETRPRSSTRWGRIRIFAEQIGRWVLLVLWLLLSVCLGLVLGVLYVALTAIPEPKPKTKPFLSKVWVFCGVCLALIVGVEVYVAARKSARPLPPPPLFSTNMKRSPLETRTLPEDGQTYVWIPAGVFTMGCDPKTDECGAAKPAHVVTITKGFWLGQTEVTQQAFATVLGRNPTSQVGDMLPAIVLWEDAHGYCEAVGARLPTEAEWEFAARAGTTGKLYGKLENIAWSSSAKSPPHSQPPRNPLVYPVAQKQPNAWKLYDMLGNAAEWVSDWYGNYGSDARPLRDPQGPATGPGKIDRGGSVGDPASISAFARTYTVSDGANGFRCAGN